MGQEYVKNRTKRHPKGAANSIPYTLLGQEDPEYEVRGRALVAVGLGSPVVARRRAFGVEVGAAGGGRERERLDDHRSSRCARRRGRLVVVLCRPIVVVAVQGGLEGLEVVVEFRVLGVFVHRNGEDRHSGNSPQDGPDHSKDDQLSFHID